MTGGPVFAAVPEGYAEMPEDERLAAAAAIAEVIITLRERKAGDGQAR